METILRKDSKFKYTRYLDYKSTKIFRMNDIETKFKYLANNWERDTGISSKKKEMYSHPAYQQIISMGWKVVPFIIEDLEKKPKFWLKALQDITKLNPIQEEHINDINLMIKDWLNWAKTYDFYDRFQVSE